MGQIGGNARNCLAALTAIAAAAAAPEIGAAQTTLSQINPGRLDVNPPAVRQRPHRPRRGRRPPVKAPEIKPFVLTRVEVIGSTLSPQALDAASRPFVGRTIDRAGLQVIADAMAKVYERSDIALYNINVPDQDFAGGVLRLQAVEGYIQRAAFRGRALAPGLGLARRYAARLEVERPLKRSDMERELSLIRDIPGLTPEMRLTPGEGDGAVVLEVDPNARRVQAAMSINDRGTAFLGRTQVEADIYLNSLIRTGDQTRLSVALPTDIERFQLYGFGHSQPIGDDGTTVQVYGSYLRTRPQGLDVQGRAYSLGAQVSHPLIRGNRRNLYLSASLDGLNSHNAFFGQELSNERARVVRAALAYSLTTDKSVLLASATASFGLSGMGAREDPLLAKADFRKVNLKLAYNHALGSNWVVRLNSLAQLTSDLLPASEQFSLGGEEFGRAYEASYLVGDEGYGVSGELAYVMTKGLPAALANSEIYAFADKGAVRYRSRLGQPAEDLSLASAGGGVRVPINKHVAVQIEAARGLDSPLPGVNGERWKGVFSLKTAF